MASLLCSINIPNFRLKMGFQFLVVVVSLYGNAVSSMQCAQEKLSKYSFMVSLISIAAVSDLNGLSDSTFVVSVRLR